MGLPLFQVRVLGYISAAPTITANWNSIQRKWSIIAQAGSHAVLAFDPSTFLTDFPSTGSRDNIAEKSLQDALNALHREKHTAKTPSMQA
jgi:hypothetical protein